MGKLITLTNGIIKENPVLILVLGMCPTLAVSTQAASAVGMGITTLLVLLCSNVVISALRNVIPDKVRIPCYIVLISGFVTIIQMLLKAFVPALDKSLGVYLPLVTVNCIILGRAEMYASRNNTVSSALDAIGMGLGFTLVLFIAGTVREILGSGTWMSGIGSMTGGSWNGVEIPWLIDNKISIISLAPGGFLILAFIMAIVKRVGRGKASTCKSGGCAACRSAGICGDDGADNYGEERETE